MFESVHAQWFPESIEIEGRLVFARAPALQRTAPAAGLVLSSIKPMAVVQRGATVMTIQGELFAAAQSKFLKALTTPGKSSKAFSKALHVLEQLKFAKSQINSLAQTQTIIAPLPILSPKAGLVIDILPDGTAFEDASTLFSLATEPCIEAHVDRKTMEHLRPNKEAYLDQPGRTVHLTKKEPPDASGRCRCEFRLDGDFSAREGTVRLTIHFAPWERLGPDFTYEQLAISEHPPRTRALRSGITHAPQTSTRSRSEDETGQSFRQGRRPSTAKGSRLDRGSRPEPTNRHSPVNNRASVPGLAAPEDRRRNGRTARVYAKVGKASFASCCAQRAS